LTFSALLSFGRSESRSISLNRRTCLRAAIFPNWLPPFHRFPRRGNFEIRGITFRYSFFSPFCPQPYYSRCYPTAFLGFIKMVFHPFNAPVATTFFLPLSPSPDFNLRANSSLTKFFLHPCPATGWLMIFSRRHFFLG